MSLRTMCTLAGRLWVGLAALAFAPAAAEPIDVEGVVFSDELGGFRLVSASGSGTRDDPYVIEEHILGTGPAVLVIRGAGITGPRHYQGLRLTLFVRKIVINDSGFVWNRYNLELREHVNATSDYYDGLSFDQPKSTPRPFRSDRFPQVLEHEEPHDSLYFVGALVAPGERFSMDVVITDPTPRSEFYLRQSMEVPTASTGPPGVVVAGGTALPGPRDVAR